MTPTPESPALAPAPTPEPAPEPAPEQPRSPPKPRRTFASALFGVLMTLLLLGVGGLAVWLYLDGVALKLVLPDPKPPPKTSVAWDDPRLGALADRHLRCTQRQDALLRIPGCRRVRTIAQGDEVQCAMEPPLQALSFGCGPYGDSPPLPFTPRLTLTAADTTWLAIQAQRWFGDCRAQGVGPVVGAPPRWPDDLGDAACFWLGGMRPLDHPTSDPRRFPVGFFAAFSPLPMSGHSAASWRALTLPQAPLPTTLPLRALTLDATHLSAIERLLVGGYLYALFHRPNYVRSDLSLQMEAYARRTSAKPTPP